MDTCLMGDFALLVLKLSLLIGLECDLRHEKSFTECLLTCDARLFALRWLIPCGLQDVSIRLLTSTISSAPTRQKEVTLPPTTMQNSLTFSLSGSLSLSPSLLACLMPFSTCALEKMCIHLHIPGSRRISLHHVVVSFPSLVRILGECSTIYFPHMLFFLKWRLAHAH